MWLRCSNRTQRERQRETRLIALYSQTSRCFLVVIDSLTFSPSLGVCACVKIALSTTIFHPIQQSQGKKIKQNKQISNSTKPQKPTKINTINEQDCHIIIAGQSVCVRAFVCLFVTMLQSIYAYLYLCTVQIKRIMFINSHHIRHTKMYICIYKKHK